MPQQHAHPRDRIGLEFQNVPADDRVEWAIERQFRRVAVQERHVARRQRVSSAPGNLERGCSAIDPGDLADVPDQLSCQKRDVADTGADVEHPHATCDPGRQQEAARDRLDQASLDRQPIKLTVRVAKHIPARLRLPRRHRSRIDHVAYGIRPFDMRTSARRRVCHSGSRTTIKAPIPFWPTRQSAWGAVT